MIFLFLVLNSFQDALHSRGAEVCVTLISVRVCSTEMFCY